MEEQEYVELGVILVEHVTRSRQKFGIVYSANLGFFQYSYP
jgi:hypothetical protein